MLAPAQHESATTQPAAETPAFDWAPLDEILDEYQGQRGAVIPILQRAQDAYGYLPRELLARLARKTGVPVSQLAGVATFYAQFHRYRRGRHLIRICDGTACHVRGASRNIEAVQTALAVPAGGTSPDYKYTLEIVYCLGSCGLSPVVLVDGKVCGRLDPDELLRRLEALA